MIKKSISRKPIKILIEGLGEAEGELIRFLAPRTVSAIIHKLPLGGRAAILNKKIYFQTNIRIGKEKSKRNVSSGTIAYWPMANALCIFYEDSISYGPVNIVGQVT
ncbi:unnamed protein product, partial [marine sediment metagenome]